jgi:hypothetical protein
VTDTSRRASAHALAHFLPPGILCTAHGLSLRYQREERFRKYVATRVWAIVPVAILMVALSLVCATGALLAVLRFASAEAGWTKFLLLLLWLGIFFGGVLAQLILLFSILERRAMDEAEKTLPALTSRGLWICFGIFILLPLLLIALAPAAAPWLAAAMGKPYIPCRERDKACAARAISSHAVKRLDYWESALAKPLEERIGAAPAELVAYMALDNLQRGIRNRPRMAVPAPDFTRDVRQALAELPPQVRAPLAAKLAGLYFIEDIGGTGFTDQIVDASAKAVAGFVVLDPSALSRTANSWATWKENMPFRAAPGIRLEALIESETHNDRKNAIQYILLHELGHIFAIGSAVHPSWVAPPDEVRSTAEYPFFALTWTHSPDRRGYISVFDDSFPQRKNVAYYYASARLEAGQMLDVYAALERTNFATLYAVTNPFDDFAEAFASYVHGELMGKPWEIRLYRDEKLAKSYRPCWGQPRCRPKEAILEKLLGR